MQFKKIEGCLGFEGILYSTLETCYQIILVKKDEIIAIYYISKESFTIFNFIPVEYTYANHAVYDKAIQSIIEKLKSGI